MAKAMTAKTLCVLACFLEFGVVDSARHDTSIYSSAPAKVDVTSLVKDRNDLHCCCVAGGHACQVFFFADMQKQKFWRNPKCDDFKADWSDEKLKRFTRTGGSCNVSASEVAALMHRMGTAKNYCQFLQPVENLSPLRTRARLGETVKVRCPEGWELAAEVSCKFESTEQGRFHPQPKCIAPDTVDVTRLISARDTVDLRCCCESSGARCQVTFLKEVKPTFWRQPKCKDFPVPQWASNDELRHYTGIAGKHCAVRTEDFPLLLEKLGTPDTYCSFEASGHAQNLNARLGQVLQVKCQHGWEQTASVTCSFGDMNRGKFLPQPACKPKEQYCRALNGAPATRLGETVEVSCGALPVSSGPVTCVAHSEFEGMFHPRPACSHPGGFGSAYICMRKVHTFVVFRDKGCFPHISWSGVFFSKQHEITYKRKLCPFAGDTVQSQLRRSLLVWYKSLATECFLHIDREARATSAAYYKIGCPLPAGEDQARRKELADSQRADEAETAMKRGSRPRTDRPSGIDQTLTTPFSMSDLAHSCVKGQPDMFAWDLKRLKAWLGLALEVSDVSRSSRTELLSAAAGGFFVTGRALHNFPAVATHVG